MTYAMKKYIFLSFALLVATLTWVRCTDYPVDEDGLLITYRAECYVSNFDLLGKDSLEARQTSLRVLRRRAAFVAGRTMPAPVLVQSTRVRAQFRSEFLALY